MDAVGGFVVVVCKKMLTQIFGSRPPKACVFSEGGGQQMNVCTHSRCAKFTIKFVTAVSCNTWYVVDEQPQGSLCLWHICIIYK